MDNKEAIKKKSNKLLGSQSDFKTFLSIILIGLLLFIFDKPLFEIILLKDSGLLKSLIKFDYSSREWAIILFWILAFFYAFLFIYSIKEKKFKRKIGSIPLDITFILLGVYYTLALRNGPIIVGEFNFYFASFSGMTAIPYTDIFFLLPLLGISDILIRIYDICCRKKLENSSVWENDTPLNDIEEDLMSRKTLALNVSKQINAYSNNKSSFSIGIVGPWGSGKSSFLNFIFEEIKNENQNIVLKFNPWLYPDETSLTRAFLNELEIKLKEYSSSLSRDVNNIVDSLFKTKVGFSGIFSNLLKREKSIESGIESLKESIIYSQKRLVIFIDDIDRLQSNEVYEILTILRNVGNLPNTVFVLAYDKDYLLKIMDKSIENPQEYLSKFFQVEFALSRVLDVFVKETLYEQLVKIVFDNNQNDNPLILFRDISKSKKQVDKKALKELVYNLKSINLLKSRRDIIKLTNTIAVNWPLSKNELIFEDYLELEILRLKNGNIYSKIKFLNSDWINLIEDNFRASNNFDKTDIIKKIAHHNDKEAIVKTIKHLFCPDPTRKQYSKAAVRNIYSFDSYFQNESFMVKSTLNTICHKQDTALLKNQLQEYYNNIHTRKELIDYLQNLDSYYSLNVFNTFFNFFLETEEIYQERGLIIRHALNAVYKLGDEVYENVVIQLKEKKSITPGMLHFVEDINESFMLNNPILFIERDMFDDLALKLLEITHESYTNMADAFKVFTLNMVFENHLPQIKSTEAQELINNIAVYNFLDFLKHIVPINPNYSNGRYTFQVHFYASLIFESWEKFHAYLKNKQKHSHTESTELTEFVSLFNLFEQTGYSKEGMSISAQELEKYPILKSKLQGK